MTSNFEQILSDTLIEFVTQTDYRRLIDLCLKNENISNIVPLILNNLKDRILNELWEEGVIKEKTKVDNEIQSNHTSLSIKKDFLLALEKFPVSIRFSLIKKLLPNSQLLNNRFHSKIPKPDDEIYDAFLKTVSTYCNINSVQEISKNMELHTKITKKIEVLKERQEIYLAQFFKIQKDWEELQLKISRLQEQDQMIKEEMRAIPEETASLIEKFNKFFKKFAFSFLPSLKDLETFSSDIKAASSSENFERIANDCFYKLFFASSENTYKKATGYSEYPSDLRQVMYVLRDTIGEADVSPQSLILNKNKMKQIIISISKVNKKLIVMSKSNEMIVKALNRLELDKNICYQNALTLSSQVEFDSIDSVMKNSKL